MKWTSRNTYLAMIVTVLLSVAVGLPMRSQTPESVKSPTHQSTTKVEEIHLLAIQLNRKKSETDEQLTTRAKQIISRLQAGELFGDLARQYSEDQKARRGGSWGWIKPSDMKSPFRDAAFKLRKGESSDPVLTSEACFIFFVADRREVSVSR